MGSTPILSAMKQEIQIDSFVQWISQGVEQFKTACRVRQIIDDPTYGKFVLVHGSNTGIPYNELVLWKNSSTSKSRPTSVG